MSKKTNAALFRNGKLSQEDKRLNKVLMTVEREVKEYADYQLSHIEQLANIGLALSIEKNIDILLEMIVDAARELTCADAGTLYLVDDSKHFLKFQILQNDTMNTRMGGTSGIEVTLPPVPLEVDGKPNYSNVSSYCALTGDVVNIPDVYEAEGFDFTGPRKYDEATGYRSKSMLVIAMRNHENDIIGVLQLLNAKDIDTDQIVSFSTEYVDLIGSLASQAAVALTNAELVQDLRDLLYSFIKSIATAIDEKSPYTAGHFSRVVDLTMMIAEKINGMKKGPFASVHFNEDEMEELKLAAWMHDVGKITTPEHVVDKSTKLETIFDRIELVKTRFDLIAQIIEKDYLNKKLSIATGKGPDNKKLLEMDDEFERKLNEVREEREFLLNCNTPKEFMDNEKLERLNSIAKKKYVLDGNTH
ncbi:MAG: GAF domain-containing protein, partial [bacterium]|nr:GAF domain-containing protein [bacterium]